MKCAGFAVLAGLLVGEARGGKPPMVMYHNDPESTGQNLDETILTHANVKAHSFGKLHTVPVDGQIYAQPLYLPEVEIKTGEHRGKHDVVFVVTMHDSVYAIDANSGQVLWHRSFLDAKNQVTPVLSADPLLACNDVKPEYGIASTPAIDIKTGTLYLTAKTKEVRAGKGHYVYRLHALDVGTSADRAGSPVVIGESTGNAFADIGSGPEVKGKGEGGNGTVVRFNALRNFQRSGVTLSNDHVYLGFGSHCDNTPYHGWVLGYHAHTLKPTAVINLTPNATSGDNGPGSRAGGAVWQAGGKLVLDAQGALYFMTGNGIFDSTLTGGFPNHGNYGDAFVKLVPDASTAEKPHENGWGLKVADYFAQSDVESLDKNGRDADLGSGGPLALPREVGSKTAPDLLVGAGKEGRIFLLNRANMGKFNPKGGNAVQETPPNTVGGMWGNPAFFRDHTGVARIYFGGNQDHLKAFTIGNAKITLPASSQTNNTFNYPGATPSISANKDRDGILWALDRRLSLLRAYDATNLKTELYNSGQVSTDALPGGVTKFTVPLIADGKVFVASESTNPKQSNNLVIYGLLPKK
jgi:outer membrane protein assembly factor BamB